MVNRTEINNSAKDNTPLLDSKLPEIRMTVLGVNVNMIEPRFARDREVYDTKLTIQES